MAGGCGTTVEEHSLWPVQSGLTAGRHEDESRSAVKGTGFEDRELKGKKIRGKPHIMTPLIFSYLLLGLEDYSHYYL